MKRKYELFTFPQDDKILRLVQTYGAVLLRGFIPLEVRQNIMSDLTKVWEAGEFIERRKLAEEGVAHYYWKRQTHVADIPKNEKALLILVNDISRRFFPTDHPVNNVSV